MNRRNLLTMLACLPFAGLFVGKSQAIEMQPLAADFKTKEYIGTNIWYPYAKAGETVTCTNGHPICDFVEDVAIGGYQDVDRELNNWRQPAPKVGDMSPRCVICNAKFYSSGYYHIGDSWRDPLEQINKFPVLRDILEKGL